MIRKKKQQRGFWLESAFYKILELEQIDHKTPYRPKYEQVDGQFKYDKFDYLVEVKWTDAAVKKKDVSIFEGKLSRKGQSTRGFVLSISGFDESAINQATCSTPKMIFMDGSEFMSVLDSYNTFYDLFGTKEDLFVRMGKVYK